MAFDILTIGTTRVKINHYGYTDGKEQVCIRVYPKDKKPYFSIGLVDDRESDIRALVCRNG